MDYQDFNQSLKKAGLSKKAFADILGIEAQSISNWNKQGVPYWVPSWIENYLKSKAYTRVRDEVLSIEGIEEV